MGTTEDEVLGDGAAYDPATDTWSELPEAPASMAFARSSGSELILAALPVGEGVEQEGGLLFQTATLDLVTRSWSAPQASPVTFWAVEWFVFDREFVNPSLDVTNPTDGASAEREPRNGQWPDVPQLPPY